MHNSGTIVRIIKIIARSSNRVAPTLAARLLERLFLTPYGSSGPDRNKGPMAEADLDWLPFDDRRRLPVYSWGQGEPILLVHGWSGRAAHLTPFVKPLLNRGCRVVAFDGPGHGQADGRMTGLPELARAVRLVADRVGPLRAVITHSLGGPATTLALAQGLSVDRLVYISPPDNPPQYLYRAARMLGFSRPVVDLARARIEDRFGFKFEEADQIRLAPTMKADLTVIHDLADKDVPHAEGAALAEAWPSARLLSTRGLGHRRILRNREVIEAAVGIATTGELQPRAVHKDLAELNRFADFILNRPDSFLAGRELLECW